MSSLHSKVYNFCAGPAVIPESVLEQAQHALIDWKGLGTSILSVSHRSDEFMEVVNQSEQDLRALLDIPSQYQVFFIQGGASAQFSMVPMNIHNAARRAAYVVTGAWGRKAAKLAQQFVDAEVIAEGVTAADCANWSVPSDVAYLHCTPNETIDGIEFTEVPKVAVPLIGDVSSTILSRPIDVSAFDMLYAGAQKNIGPAGLSVVIINQDIIQAPMVHTPYLYQYQSYVGNPMPNTPPTFAWYVCYLTFQWVKQMGGVEAMAMRNAEKAALLYEKVDQTDFYANAVPAAYRSRMNVPFHIHDSALEPVFMQEAEEQGLMGLAGHRSVGGLRASLYNAMPLEGVQALVAFMQSFEERYG